MCAFNSHYRFNQSLENVTDKCLQQPPARLQYKSCHQAVSPLLMALREAERLQRSMDK